jgi:hypothetical protein
MKTKFYALFLSVFLFACKEAPKEKICVPRPLTQNEDFNSYPKHPEDVLKLVRVEEQVQNNGGTKTLSGVTFKDSLMRIQPDAKDKTFLKDRFALAEMVNTQQTCALVQLEGSLKVQAPFFLIAAKDGNAEVISLYRASNGGNDQQFTKGMVRVGKSGYLINNDYFLTTVNAKIFPITRQNEEERIQGQYFMNSKDKTTLVFLTKDSFYQVHYPSGSVYNAPLPKKAPREVANIYKYIQDNYRWVKNGKGIEFLQYVDDDVIVDMTRKLK